MKLNKLTITGTFAHFKIPAYSKYQRSYEIPPISTVVGMLKNLYGDDISDFKLGYTINYKSKALDATTIYKELDVTEKSFKDKKRFITDLCFIEYLYDVEMYIYTDINREIKLKDTLVLGKTNCLGTLSKVEEVELINQEGFGYNQYTAKELGEGQIRRINTLTSYNADTDMYNIQGAVVRENREFEYDRNYDPALMQNIYLWNWREGKVYGAN